MLAKFRDAGHPRRSVGSSPEELTVWVGTEPIQFAGESEDLIAELK
jgi:hypothetical protein